MVRYTLVLKNKNYMLMWVGALVSDFGDRFTEFGLAWYILEKTKNPLDLAFTFLLFQLPALFSGLIVGWLLDRFPKERIMITDNVVRGGIIFLIPFLDQSHILSIPLLYLFVILLGALSVATDVGSQTLITEFVAPGEYNTANTLAVIRAQISAIGGPGIAGLFVSLFGPLTLLWIDSGTFFFFALTLLLLLRRPRLVEKEDQAQQSQSFLQNITQGIAFSFHHPLLLSLISVSFFWNLGLGILTVTLPFYCLTFLLVGPVGMGLFLSVNSIGVLLSAFLFGPRNPRYPGRVVCLLLMAQAICYGVMALMKPLWIILTVAFLLGACDEVGAIYLASLRQSSIPLPLQGRVQGFSRTAGQSGEPLGNGLAGLLLARFAPQWVVACAGLPLLLIGLLWFVTGPLRTVQHVQKSGE